MNRNETVFYNDEDIIRFMEKHNGFDLADRGLAEIIEPPEFVRKKSDTTDLDPETIRFIDELVNKGVCTDVKDAVAKAVRCYVLAVLPHSYTLVQQKQQ